MRALRDESPRYRTVRFFFLMKGVRHFQHAVDDKLHAPYTPVKTPSGAKSLRCRLLPTSFMMAPGAAQRNPIKSPPPPGTSAPARWPPPTRGNRRRLFTVEAELMIIAMVPGSGGARHCQRHKGDIHRFRAGRRWRRVHPVFVWPPPNARPVWRGNSMRKPIKATISPPAMRRPGNRDTKGCAAPHYRRTRRPS